MDRGVEPRSLEQVFDEIVAWRERTVAEIDAGLTLLAEEERQLRAAIDEGRRRASAIAAIRQEQEELASRVDLDELARKRAGVRTILVDDRRAIEARASRLATSERARDAELGQALRDPDVAAACLEYLEAREQAAGMAEALAVEPEDLVSERTRTLLAPLLERVAAPLPTLPLPPRTVGVLVSAEPPEGRAEALVLVLPVPYAVYVEGTARAEDLCAQLAYRLVGAAGALLQDLEAADAPIGYIDLHGCLALQIWLGDHAVDADLRTRAVRAVDDACVDAPELGSANVTVRGVWVGAELLTESA